MNTSTPTNRLVTCCKSVTLAALFLALINIVVSNHLSTQGQVLGQFSDEMVSLEKEKVLLGQDIAAKSALFQLADAAAQSGFVTIDRPLALEAQESVALARE